jgi:hypothetical protein
VQLVTAVVEQQDSSRSSGTRLVIVVAAIVRIGGRRGGGCRRGGVRVMRGGARVASIAAGRGDCTRTARAYDTAARARTRRRPRWPSAVSYTVRVSAHRP